jgi:hypothetical protein
MRTIVLRYALPEPVNAITNIPLRGAVMYALIIVIGMLSTGASGSAVIPVGVTSQIVGKFKNLDECKAAASQPHAGGPISDLSLSTTWGVNWYCTYTGAN